MTKIFIVRPHNISRVIVSEDSFLFAITEHVVID